MRRTRLFTVTKIIDFCRPKGMSSALNPVPDLVLPVHGTFAADREYCGENWWQIGSRVYEAIQQRIPRGTIQPKPDEVFHWTGENSERARIKAAIKLLARLKQLEFEGRGYHLIGHSHGGSVIWHALRLATLSQIELKNLRSWTTVGTPYMRQKMLKIMRFSNILRIGLGLILIKPAYVTAFTLFSLLFLPHSSLSLGRGDNLPDKLTLYETPVLRLLEIMKVPIERSASGIRVGTFDSTAEHTSFQFLLTSPLGWLSVILAIVVITIYMSLSVFLLRPVIESWQLWVEKRLERRARSLYSSRWLGLWSPNDEAINALRATLDPSMSFVSRMLPRDRVLFSDYATLTLLPYYWVMSRVFNTVLRPFLDKVVRSFLVKSAQGNNRPGTKVVEVGPVPWNVESAPDPIALPDWLNDRLVLHANDSAQIMVPELRSTLAAPSLMSLVESWEKAGLGSELVHTSYFDHTEVLDLLAMHIAGSCVFVQWPEHGLSQKSLKLANWLAEAKSRVGSQSFAESLARYLSVSMDEKPVKVPMIPRRRAIYDHAA